MKMAIVNNRAKVVISFVLFKFLFSKMQIIAGKEFPALLGSEFHSRFQSMQNDRTVREKVRTLQLCWHSFYIDGSITASYVKLHDENRHKWSHKKLYFAPGQI